MLDDVCFFSIPPAPFARTRQWLITVTASVLLTEGYAAHSARCWLSSSGNVGKTLGNPEHLTSGNMKLKMRCRERRISKVP